MQTRCCSFCKKLTVLFNLWYPSKTGQSCWKHFDFKQICMRYHQITAQQSAVKKLVLRKQLCNHLILMSSNLYFVDVNSKPSNKLNLQSDCVGDLASKHNVAGIPVAPSKIQGISSVLVYYYPPKVDNSETKQSWFFWKGRLLVSLGQCIGNSSTEKTVIAFHWHGILLMWKYILKGTWNLSFLS